MTKKDYIKFANLLIKFYNESQNETEQNMLERLREEIIELFENDNHAFNTARFNEYITKRTQ